MLLASFRLSAQSISNGNLSFQQLTDSTIFYFLKRGECDKALPFARPRRDSICLRHGSRSLEYANASRSLGDMLTRLNRFEEAEASLQLALRLADSLLPEKDSRRATYLSTYGFHLLQKGNFHHASAFYRKAILLQPLNSRNDSLAMAGITLLLGQTCYLSNQPEEAEKHLLKALDFYKSLFGPVHRELATAYLLLGSSRIYLGDYARASFWFKKAGESLAGLSDRQSLIKATQVDKMLGETFYRRKQFVAAKTHYLQALEQVRIVYGQENQMGIQGLKEQSEIYNTLGLIDFDQSAYRKALQTLQSALLAYVRVQPENHQEIQEVRLNLGLLLGRMGQYRQADSLFRLARRYMEENLGKESSELNALSMEEALLALAQGKRGEAMQRFDSLEQNIRKQVAAIFLNFAATENEAFLQKIEEYRLWISGMLASEAEKKSELTARLLDVHLHLHGLLLSSEKSVLQDLRGKNEPQLAQKTENWFALRKELARQQSEGKVKADSMVLFEERVNLLEKELIRQRSSKSALASFSRPGAEIQKMLKKGQAAVQIMRIAMPGLVTHEDHSDSLHPRYVYPQITDTIHYLACILRPGGAPPVLLYNRNGRWLEKQGLASYRNRMRWQEIDRISYKLFWSSIDSALSKDDKEIFYSPDGVYHLVNPASVLIPEQNRYLGESRNWVRLTRLQDLLEPAPDVRSARTAVLAGAPAFSPHGYQLNPADSVSVRFDSLPGTQAEIDAIAIDMRAKGWKVQQFTGSRATEESLKNIRNPQVLHLATHGYFREDSVGGSHALLNAGLILARRDSAKTGSRPDDGVLKAREALTLDLEKTRLVVLSACETGLGTSMAGEGMYGLQRAFQLAGSRNIMMSLWKVDDEATSRLMAAFYRHYLQKGDAQESLRLAQMEIRKSHPHPYFWASFVVLGI